MPATRRCPTCRSLSRADVCPVCAARLTADHDVHPLHAATLRTLAADLVRVRPRDHARLVVHLGRWVAIGAVVGILAGVSSAVFLYGLKLVTDARLDSPSLLWGLPLAGLVVGLLYHHLGDRSAAGNNLILDEIHGIAEVIDRDAAGRAGTTPPPTRVPKRLAPLVLVGTWVTHLFGGSAGREGTAIQMAGSLSDWFARTVRLDADDRRLVLIAAIAGGFGSVFGVPLAGAVFGLEVQSIGRIRYDAIVPALTASVVGNVVFDLLHLPHDVTPHHPLAPVELEVALLLKVAVAAIAFAAVAVLFAELTNGIKRTFAVLVGYPPLRPFLGGAAIVGLTAVVGSNDYLGLSLPLIDDALTGADLLWYAFALKLLFTVITLGAGFQGGEVTPLFVIGATLGATLAGPLDAPVEMLAAIGFVAVFAAATNTPLACTIMGVELFGTGALPYLALGCVVAYVVSSNHGIYGAQRLGTPKGGVADAEVDGRPLRDLNAPRPPTSDADD